MSPTYVLWFSSVRLDVQINHEGVLPYSPFLIILPLHSTLIIYVAERAKLNDIRYGAKRVKNF